MDPYSLKRDNRKKFQDKQRLKHRHATPSDRKYRTLNYQEKQREEEQTRGAEEEEEPVPSNEYRYHEDVTMTYQNPAEAEKELNANRLAREVLRARGGQDDPLIQSERPKEALTTKDLHAMEIEGLNELLGGKQSRPATKSHFSSQKPAKITPKKDTKPGEKVKQTSSVVPDELTAEQDFLDGLL